MASSKVCFLLSLCTMCWSKELSSIFLGSAFERIVCSQSLSVFLAWEASWRKTFTCDCCSLTNYCSLCQESEEMAEPSPSPLSKDKSVVGFAFFFSFWSLLGYTHFDKGVFFMWEGFFLAKDKQRV